MRTTRTYRAKILNHSQVKEELDQCGFAASKLWNVGRWYVQQRWDEDGEIPNGYELKTELKDHERYRDLHSQSSQQVLEELAEAFKGWYEKRKNGDKKANPPGYRKRGDKHPRSTVTWKQQGIRHDKEHNRLRLSKGFNLKEKRNDYILCEYQVRPDVTVKNIKVVRAVWNGGEWRLHIVCRKDIEVEDQSDGKTAGIDLGIKNYLVISYEDGTTELYPGNSLKEDKHYFTQIEYDTEGKNGSSNKALWARKKLSRRREHFLHTLSKHIVERCVEKSVGRIAIGDLKHIREKDNGEMRSWGRSGNKKLYGWAFEQFTKMLEYKAKENGIEVVRVDEKDTSKTCSVCGNVDGESRVERGLYVCKECGAVTNGDVNGAENIRQKITQKAREGMGNGCVAQPTVYLFNTTAGTFQPQEQIGCKP